MDDYDIEYARRRKDLFPLDLSPQGPYREIFGIWQSKINAARGKTLEKFPSPTLWDLTRIMAYMHLFKSEIEREAWMTLKRNLAAYFNVADSEGIPIKL